MRADQTVARSLVIPLYMESRRLPSSLSRLVGTPLATSGLELVLVDDGSTDETAATAETLLAGHGLTGRVLRLPANAGKGAAVQAGMLEARGATVAFTDADLSTGPRDIERAFLLVEQGYAPVVAATRVSRDSSIPVMPPWRRRIAGRVFNLLVRASGLSDLSDTQCGLKAFRADAARAVFEGLVAERFAFDVEVLARARSLGYEVREFPVAWSWDPDTKVHLGRDSRAMLAELWRIRRRYGPVTRRPPAVGSPGS